MANQCADVIYGCSPSQVGSPSSFAPGPYIIGSVVPRCFDSSRAVQSRALQCLELTVRILSAFEGRDGDGESVERALSRLKARNINYQY